MTDATITSATDLDETDGELFHIKTIFRRSSKGPVMFNGCSPSGDVIIIDNISKTKEYNITGWYIERQTDTCPIFRYIFTNQLIIPPLTTIELWSNTAIPTFISVEAQEQQQSFISIKTKLSTWNSARQWSVTRLFNDKGQEKAIFSHRTLTSTDELNNE